MGFFAKACVQALKDIPAVNAEIDGTDLIYKNYYHIGVAVGTDKGLVVPVVRDCDHKSIAEIEKAIADFGRRARDGQLKIDEMQGGTFTITNGGIYGSLMSTPILNAPQSGILGMHKIQERPMVVGGKIEIRPMMYLALSYDHRVDRRQGGGDVPGARQGEPGRSGAAGAGSLSSGSADAPSACVSLIGACRICGGECDGQGCCHHRRQPRHRPRHRDRRRGARLSRRRRLRQQRGGGDGGRRRDRGARTARPIAVKCDVAEESDILSAVQGRRRVRHARGARQQWRHCRQAACGSTRCRPSASSA